MTWRDAVTREVRFFEALAITLILLGLLATGVAIGASLYRGLALEQGAQLESYAARRCVWWYPSSKPLHRSRP